MAAEGDVERDQNRSVDEFQSPQQAGQAGLLADGVGRVEAAMDALARVLSAPTGPGGALEEVLYSRGTPQVAYVEKPKVWSVETPARLIWNATPARRVWVGVAYSRQL